MSWSALLEGIVVLCTYNSPCYQERHDIRTERLVNALGLIAPLFFTAFILLLSILHVPYLLYALSETLKITNDTLCRV